MKKFKLYKISSFLSGFLVLWLIPILNSCASEEPAAGGGNSVKFFASIRESDEVMSRAVVYNPVLPGTYGNTPFYIYSTTTQQDNMEQYKVAAGIVGQLTAIEPNDQLIWRNKTEYHTFYGWTMPWQPDNFKVGDNPAVKISFLQEDYQNLGLDFTQWYNCRILENFIGAKTSPLNYETNGDAVEMYFQHLVSKIHINAAKLVDNEGYTTNVTATMTFYQMPQSAIFNRMPADGGAPRVEMDRDALKGVSCTVGSPTTLYVCPGIDFANMQFSIHVENQEGAKGDYFGDFRSVIFKRTDTDQPEWDADKSTTILYAGEEMTIDLTIRDGNAGGISVNISNWTDRGWRNATGYSRKGIFSDSELLDLYNKFGQDYTQETVDEVFDIYGEEVNGEKVIYLYEDGQLSHTRLPVAKELVLDGTGHTVQITNVTHGINGKNAPYVAHVGRCRNIFITNGTHIIYIDENYRVWLVDSETLQMTQTEYVLPELKGNSNSYYIDYETGDFQLSDSH